MSLHFKCKIDYRSTKARFDAIGSKEFPRAVQFALDNTIKSATIYFRDKVLRQVAGAGAKVQGDILSEQFDSSITQFTKNGIRYTRAQGRSYDSIKSMKDISASIYITKKVSPYLKYLFGDSENTRRPGDVGLDSRVIRVPLGQNLRLSQSVRIDPWYRGGPQPRNMLKIVLSNLVKENPDGDIPSHVMGRGWGQTRNQVEAMRRMGRRGYSAPTASNDEKRRRVLRQNRNIGIFGVDEIARNHAARGNFVAANREFKYLNPALEMDKKNRDSTFGKWPVYRGPDKKNGGNPTFFARPQRIVDPLGRPHYVRRSDGTMAKFRSMKNVAPEFGEEGPRVGPRKLFSSLSSAQYKPILQKPWDINVEMAQAKFADYIESELVGRIIRKEQGRKF